MSRCEPPLTPEPTATAWSACLAAAELSLEVEEVLGRLQAVLSQGDAGPADPLLERAAIGLREAAERLEEASDSGCANVTAPTRTAS